MSACEHQVLGRCGYWIKGDHPPLLNCPYIRKRQGIYRRVHAIPATVCNAQQPPLQSPPYAKHKPPLTSMQDRRRRVRPACRKNRLSANATAAEDTQGLQEALVTLLFGFEDSGKTSLLKHILLSFRSTTQASSDVRIGAVVMDGISMSSFLQAQIEAGTEASSQAGNAVQDWNVSGNSCVCQSSSQDEVEGMLELTQRLAKAGIHCSNLVLECAGTSVPLPTAMLLQDELCQSDSSEAQYVQVRKLDTLVTLVDAQRFLMQIWDSEYLLSQGLTQDEADDRTIADVLVEQVEYANTLVINKVDLVSDAQVKQLELLLRKLNHSAQILTAICGQVPTNQVLGTGSFDLGQLEQAPGWLAELNAFFEGGQAQQQHKSLQASEEAQHGVGSFVYYAQRPFHPQRLMDQALSMEWQGVVRSKGFFWLASRHDYMGAWQSAGTSWQAEPSALWEAAKPQEERAAADAAASTSQPWHEQWGDRCQQIAWIGIDMDEQQLRGMLDRCLLSDEEMAGGPEAWQGMEDQLPTWFEGDGVEEGMHT